MYDVIMKVVALVMYIWAKTSNLLINFRNRYEYFRHLFLQQT